MGIETRLMYQGANLAYLFAPTILTAPLTGGTLNFSENVKITGHPARGSALVASLANRIYDDVLETNILSVYLTDSAVEPAEFSAEDGTKVNLTSIPSSASSKVIVFLHYSNAVNSKYMVTAFAGLLSGATGDISTAGKALADAPIEATSVPSPATYTIPLTVIKALCPNTGVTGATVVIAAGSYGTRTWIS
jgi:hypothetical protein